MSVVLMTFLACTAIDGDTLRCERERVRLARIDAAEVGEPGADEATQALRLMADGKKVVCAVYGRERYGRLLGDCFAEGGPSFSDTLLDSGLVEPYRGRKP